MWLAAGNPGEAGPAPDPSDFPNEPVGYTQITERPFDSITEGGWTETSVANMAIVTEGGAPHSPSNAGRARYKATDPGGTSPVSISKSWTKVSELYVYFAWKVSANWQGHDSGTNKIAFVVADDYGGGGDPAYFSAQGADTGTLRFQVRLQGPGDEESQSVGGNLVTTEGGAALTRGVWYEIEVQLIANTGDNYDGECRVWFNDSLTHQYTDVRFFHESVDPSSHKFEKIKLFGTWGGAGDEVEETMYQYFDHIYVSGL